MGAWSLSDHVSQTPADAPCRDGACRDGARLGNVLFVASTSPYGATDLPLPITSAITHWRQAKSRLATGTDPAQFGNIELALRSLRENSAALARQLETVRTGGGDADNELDGAPSADKRLPPRSARELQGPAGPGLLLNLSVVRQTLSKVLEDTAELRIYIDDSPPRLPAFSGSQASLIGPAAVIAACATRRLAWVIRRNPAWMRRP
jgi:hypothetical protein